MKQCSRCQETKSLEDFNFKDKSKGIYSTYCRSCQSEVSKEHYLKYQDRYKSKAKSYARAQRDKLRPVILDYLKSHPCIDCGETDPIVLEFDHRVPEEKSFGIANAIIQGDVSLTKVLEEINKCDIRCANCHRRKTAKDRNYWRKHG